MSFTLWVPGRLPGLNELLSDKSTQNGRWNRYNEQKQRWYGQIKLLCQAKRVEPQPSGFGTFLFVEPNQKRDPDNIVAGGVKLLLDSLVGAQVIAGDGWQHNLGYVGYWVRRDNRSGCLIYWNETGVLTKDAAVALLEKELGHEPK